MLPGGCAGFYTYGPPGAALKANIISLWRRHFVIEENLLEIEARCIFVVRFTWDENNPLEFGRIRPLCRTMF